MAKSFRQRKRRNNISYRGGIRPIVPLPLVEEQRKLEQEEKLANRIVLALFFVLMIALSII